MASKIQKNRIKLILTIFIVLILLITASWLAFSFWQKRNFQENLKSHNQILEIHNQAFFLTKEKYTEISELTEQNTISFSQVEDLETEKEVLLEKSEQAKIQKNQLERVNTKLQDLEKELAKIETSDELNTLNSKTFLSLKKYQDFNWLLFNYLDFYSCQLDNLATQKGLEKELFQQRINLKVSQDREDLANSFQAIAKEIDQLVEFLPNYQNCFNTEDELIRTEKQNFYQVLTDLIDSYQELSQTLKELSGSIQDKESNKYQEKVQQVEEIEKKIQDQHKEFKARLRAVLNKFDESIEKLDLKLEKLSERIEKESKKIANNQY